MKTLLINVLTLFFLFLIPTINFGQTPDLGATSSFALFTGNGAFNELGTSSTVVGDVGTNVGAFNAFPPGALTGDKYEPGSPTAIQAAADVTDLYNYLAGLPPTNILPSPTLGGGQILTAGIHSIGTLASMNGILTLNGENDPNALFIIQIGGAFSTGVSASVVLTNLASPKNVYWQINGAFTLGDFSTFKGNIVAFNAISLLESSSLEGRGLSVGGAISLHNNSVLLSLMPGDAGTITGTSPVCQGQTNVQYSVAVIENATDYLWTLPTGASIALGDHTNTIMVDFSASAVSGVITVQGSNSSGTGAVSPDYNVVVNPSIGPTSFTSGATTVCQNAPDETYIATATNSTSITYSVLPLSAGVINATTGVMNWDALFSGNATIKATASGLCESTFADLIVTVNPSTGLTIFTSGNSTLCQNAPDETYVATAANSTSMSYSVLPLEAGVINSTSGVMNWDALFSGNATIKATATGLCGSTFADLIVTVNPSTGPTIFISGPTTVCQNAPDATYEASSENSTSITYSVLPLTAGVINPLTGVMNWDEMFTGTAMVTASSTGLCGNTSDSRMVMVDPPTGITIFTSGATELCQDAEDETYTATATNSSSISYSVLPLEAGLINSVTGVMNWDKLFSGDATITATAIGLCGTTSAERLVTVNGSTGTPRFISGSTTVCQDAPNEIYTATAINSISITYSVVPENAGVINALTGEMNWDANFTDDAMITATATGECGTKRDIRIVIINQMPVVPLFTSGATTVCRDAENEIYSAVSENSFSVTYSVLPESAGIMNEITGEMDWDEFFTGTATIQAIAMNMCGTKTANRLVTIDPSSGAPVFVHGSSIVCQNGVNENYQATSSNNNPIVYSVMPLTAGVINSLTGEMNWDELFSGIATITASTTDECGITSTDLMVNVISSNQNLEFIDGPTEVCQDGDDETYTAITTSGTSISYSVLPLTAGVINNLTGLMNWNANFTGIATITATSNSECGIITSDWEVNVSPLPGIPIFISGPLAICQNTSNEIYRATSTNSYSIVYSVIPNEAGIINANTGLMEWDALFKGEATIRATANGFCGTSTNTRLVQVNSLPNGFASDDEEICTNNSIQIGTSPVNGNNYNWSSNPIGFTSQQSNPIVKPMVTTTYTLVETNTLTGCQNTGSVKVIVSPLPLAIAGSNVTNCQCGAVILGAPAIDGHTYLWSPSAGLSSTTESNPVANPSVTTTYTLVETNTLTGCQNSNSVTVSVNTAAVIVDQPTNQSACEGSTVSFNVNATGNNLTYQWRNGNVNLQNGGNISGATTARLAISSITLSDAALNYNVLITDNECSMVETSQNVSLTVNTSPAIVFEPTDVTVCEAGSSANFWVAATGTNLTYQWRKGASNLSNNSNVSGATSAILTLQNTETTDVASNYNVVVSGTCSPSVTSRNVSFDICNSSTTDNASFEIGNTGDVVAIFPNPFSTTLDIFVNDESRIKNCELGIYNINGERVIIRALNKQHTTIETNYLSEGVYFYKIISNNEIIQSGKLVSKQ